MLIILQAFADHSGPFYLDFFCLLLTSVFAYIFDPPCLNMYELLGTFQDWNNFAKLKELFKLLQTFGYFFYIFVHFCV